MAAQCPAYISARSAEVILSDVRPIKLKPEALHSINVLLDEVLYTILTVSRSLATDRLKAALVRTLPTSLGKEALLEAEVELKAYWDRTGSGRPSLSSRGGDSGAYDLQWSYELLRLKCEAYSTMNDTDEDADAEKRLQQRMEATGSATPPSPTLLAPAALYLTAILEAICEHVLSNVSRVASRDSSRTLATVQDLFIALGEDDTIYSMFKAMKVYEHIEALSKAHRPRRSKSFSRSIDRTGSARNSASSPFGGESARGGRLSTDSTKSITVVGSGESRTSVDKGRGGKIFHARQASDKVDAALAGAAETGPGRESGEFEDEAELAQEFDELMRSGTTMKVSLTPDRLKSMEVYKQERSERDRQGRRAGQAEKGVDSGAATANPTEHRRFPNGRPALRHVDSIIEDEEEGSTAPPLQSNAAMRTRNMSLTTASPSATNPPTRASDPRLRSVSISNVPHPRHEDGISRKSSNSKRPSGRRLETQNTAPAPAAMDGPNSTPKRTRKVQRARESMDLDDIMAGSDGEGDVGESKPSRGPTTSSSPISPRKPSGGPHISRAAQDLIAFLDAGPPEEPSYNSTANASVISFESSKGRSGRLQRMMSKLTIGGSKEGLHSAYEEAPKTPRSLSRKPSKANMATSPPPSYKLNSKRSIPNVAGSATMYPNVIIATPPPRPPSHSVSSSSSGLPPPLSVSNSQTSSAVSTDEGSTLSQSSSLTRRGTRKAVPTFSEDGVVSPSGSDSGEGSRHMANGRRAARIIDDSPSVAPEATSPVPASRRPAPLNGFPVKVDTSDVVRTQAACATSPSSAVDRKSIHGHSKAESGYASRSTSRSPVTPSEKLPPPPPLPPTLTVTDAEDMRALLARATTADECRLVVDLFLARNGFPFRELPSTAPVEATIAQTEDALVLAARDADDIERGLVALFLGGGGHVDKSDAPSSPQEPQPAVSSAVAPIVASTVTPAGGASAAAAAAAGEASSEAEPAADDDLANTVAVPVHLRAGLALPTPPAESEREPQQVRVGAVSARSH
ncbi:uncharacterized protein BXZ73DRAFT_44012 [Epithele typhae]|uniref:uncharacterized protein n=1 Tax=Epithele typhae TaxID=378194 RepID=UPI0020085A63|nr:uncharacterized protein BXZ73DRAFT_44012 [Epithele typhae]KAH9939258.1 hypothetical protein BXZ73DRAFT_44012 [Epithele typhae]